MTLRLACGALCVLLACGVFWSAAHWGERRGVFDDLGYLRQAHLFKRFGIAGLNTDIRRDDDHFFRNAVLSIQHLAWSDPDRPITHTFIADNNTWVLQYPPGTGALLALFPEGRQAAGLYISSTLVVLSVALLLTFRARSVALLIASGIFGALSVYLMVNPVKASYSAAPSMAVCALLGVLTPLLFSPHNRWRLVTAVVIGLLLGIGADLRIANILLAAGFGAGCLRELVRCRFAHFKGETALLVIAIVVGAAPTLAANWINAGSPFATTYSSVDASPPDLTFSAALYYMQNPQGGLLMFGLVGAVLLYSRTQLPSIKAAALVAIVNCIVSAAFFFTHQLYTPYYLMPAAMLSSWIMLASFGDAERLYADGARA